MNKVMKIALAASAMLAISFTLSCSVLKPTGKKWCIIEAKEGAINTKSCFKIGPTYIKNELICVAANGKVLDTAKKSECTIYDDGSKKK